MSSPGSPSSLLPAPGATAQLDAVDPCQADPSSSGDPGGSKPGSPMSVPTSSLDSGLHINFLRFNQDVSSLSVATNAGYKLFSFPAGVDTLECVHAKRMEAENAVSIVERLFSSSLVALVQRASPRKLRVCHFKKGTEICNYSYSNNVLSVRLNRARLVVCLEEALYIHNIRDMKIMHTIKDTPPNPEGLCALSINSDKCYLAYPGSSTSGEVQLFDAMNLQATGMIAAHDGPLAALTFSPEGTKLATASEKGTVIRVFNVEDGTKITEFRRGVKRCAHVRSLSFSADSRFLVLGSNTETIHVFRFPEEQQQPQQVPEKPTASNPEDESWMGYFSSAVSVTASYLPTQVTDTLNQSRAFTTVTVPKIHTEGSTPNQVALAYIGKKMRVLLATSDGYLFIYDLSSSEGGECALVKQHRLNLDFSSRPTSICNPAATTEVVLADAPRATTTYAGQHITEEKMSAPEQENDECGERPAVLAVTRHETLPASSPMAGFDDEGVRDDDADVAVVDEDSDSPPPVQKMPVKLQGY